MLVDCLRVILFMFCLTCALLADKCYATISIQTSQKYQNNAPFTVQPNYPDEDIQQSLHFPCSANQVGCFVASFLSLVNAIAQWDSIL